MTERAEDPQSATLRAFTFLSSLRPHWGGALVIACGLSSGGEQFSIASNIVGAGSLTIDSRSEVCRATLRSAACDFVVNSLDEALRILKNEIRKHRPVSVALSTEETAALEELADRGVQPEMFAAFGEASKTAQDAALRFSAIGAGIVGFHRTLGIGFDADTTLEQFTSQHGLSSATFLFPTGEQLRVMDARLIQLVPPDDPRRLWFASAPRFFHRERPYRRLAFLTSIEQEKLEM